MSHPPAQIADQLIQGVDLLRPQITLAVIEELYRRVEEQKFQDPTRALQIADTAVMAAGTLDDPQATARAAWAKATALLFGGRAGEALPFYRQAERTYGELGELIEQVGVQAPLVYALNADGDTATALRLAADVRQRCQTMGESARRPLAYLEMNIGTIRKQQGAFAESLAACDNAKALFLALQDHEAAARAELNRANVLQEMDRFAEAAAAYAAARAPLVHSQRNRQQVALIDFNLGLLAERRGRFGEALRYLETAHDEFIPTIHKAATDLNRALIYNRLNLPAEAQELAQHANHIFVENGMAMESGHALLVVGEAARQMCDQQRAATAFSQAADAFTQQQSTFWLISAQLAQAQLDSVHKECAKIATPLDLALLVKEKADRADWPTLSVESRLTIVRTLLSSVSCSGRTSETRASVGPSIIPLLQEALSIAEQYHLTLHLLEIYRLLGRYYEQQGMTQQARDAYWQAIAHLQAARLAISLDELQLGYLADKSQIYTEAAALYTQATATQSCMTRDHAALLYLLDLAAVAPLSQRRTEPIENDAHTTALWAELEQLQEERRWQQHKITDPTATHKGLHTTLNQLEHRITDCWRRIGIRQHQQTASGTEPIGPPTAAAMTTAATTLYQQVQKRLAPNAALLCYTTLPHGLFALIVRAQESHLIPLGDQQTIAQALAAWRFHINDHRLIHGAPEVAQAMAQRLLATFHEQLFAPLEPLLTTGDQLFLSLPATLHDLPVAAFWHEGYLIERFCLTHLTAPSALCTQQRDTTKPSPSAAPLVIAHDAAGRVPNALREGELVATLLDCIPTNFVITGEPITNPPITNHQLTKIQSKNHQSPVHDHRHPSTLLIGEAATSTALLAAIEDASLIHIAAHAELAPTGPLFSSITLADRELPLMDLYHAAHLQHAPLVVLSTCVSGQGVLRGGGLLGLARAFFAIGASQMITTLWQIDDQTTTTLMQTFYQQLTTHSPSASPGQALHAVQQQLAPHHHPFFWAGFLHVQG